MIAEIDEKNLAQLQARAEGDRLRRRLPEGALRRRARLHQPGHRPAARLRRDQASRRRSARLPAPGHDGLDRHRGRAPRRDGRDSRREPSPTPPPSRPWVMAVEGRRLVRKPVKLGLRGEGYVEVLEGLAPGDLVVATAGTALQARRPRARGAGCPRQRAMNPFAFFEWIVAFRFMREGLTQSLLIIFGVALGGGVIIFMSALLGGLAGEHRAAHAQLPGADLDPAARPGGAAAARRGRRRNRGADPAALAAVALGRPVAEGPRTGRADAGRHRRDAQSSPVPASRSAARRPSR